MDESYISCPIYYINTDRTFVEKTAHVRHTIAKEYSYPILKIG
jgi:hypothetical protein